MPSHLRGAEEKNSLRRFHTSKSIIWPVYACKLLHMCSTFWNEPWNKLEICQKIYTTGFSDQKFYTLKVRNLQLFLLKKKQRKCINLVAFLLEFNRVCKLLTVSEQNHTWCV